MSKGIDYFAYDNPFIKVKTYFSLRARKRMYDIFMRNMQPGCDDSILDLGATPDTVLSDSNFFEKLYPYKENITVASIEDCSSLVETFGLKAFVFNKPGERLPFADRQFDILFCSAVLEHVGTREDQIFFLRECQRVAKKVFLSTPNRYFPLEMHTFIPFLHWLPWKLFQKIVLVTKGPFWADIRNLDLISIRDARNMTKGLPIRVSYVRTLCFKSNIILMTDCNGGAA